MNNYPLTGTASMEVLGIYVRVCLLTVADYLGTLPAPCVLCCVCDLVVLVFFFRHASLTRTYVC